MLIACTFCEVDMFGDRSQRDAYGIGLDCLGWCPYLISRSIVPRGGGMFKGGAMAPQNFEFFKNIYTIILIFSKFILKNKSWPPQIFELVQ